jgi:hypothetical protein
MNLTTQMEMFLLDNTINGYLEDFIQKIENKEPIREIYLANLWNDYHTLGDILNELKKEIDNDTIHTR